MKMNRTLWVCLCVVLFTPFIGCFPTTDDVNAMQDANQTFNQGLHDAGNELMTEQHSAMTPELAEAFSVMQAQYNELSLQLKARAGEVKAKGPSLGGFSGFGEGIIPSLLSMFGLGALIPIYNMFFGKSRAAKEITELKHQLAKKAGTDQELPG